MQLRSLLLPVNQHSNCFPYYPNKAMLDGILMQFRGQLGMYEQFEHT